MLETCYEELAFDTLIVTERMLFSSLEITLHIPFLVDYLKVDCRTSH